MVVKSLRECTLYNPVQRMTFSWVAEILVLENIIDACEEEISRNGGIWLADFRSRMANDVRQFKVWLSWTARQGKYKEKDNAVTLFLCRVETKMYYFSREKCGHKISRNIVYLICLLGVSITCTFTLQIRNKQKICTQSKVWNNI